MEYLLGRRQPGKRWIAARLRGEEGRLELARRMLTIGHEAGQDTFRGAGAWFLDFMEDQLRHLDVSALRWDQAAFYGLVVAARLAALGALASALADRAFDTLRNDHAGFATIQGKAAPLGTG